MEENCFKSAWKEKLEKSSIADIMKSLVKENIELKKEMEIVKKDLLLCEMSSVRMQINCDENLNHSYGELKKCKMAAKRNQEGSKYPYPDHNSQTVATKTAAEKLVSDIQCIHVEDINPIQSDPLTEGLETEDLPCTEDLMYRYTVIS